MEVDRYKQLYENRNKKRIKKKYIFILIAIIALLTNPGDNKHREAVYSRLNSYMDSHSRSPVAAMKGNPYLEQVMQTSVHSNSYLFFSTTNVTWKDDSYVVGFGVFGMVFISNAVDSYLNSVRSF